MSIIEFFVSNSILHSFVDSWCTDLAKNMLLFFCIFGLNGVFFTVLYYEESVEYIDLTTFNTCS